MDSLEDDEFNKITNSRCEYTQLDIFLAQYSSILKANICFIQKDYAKAKEFADRSEIRSEHHQDWVHCLHQFNPIFMIEVKRCAEFFLLCESQRYSVLDMQEGKQKQNAMITFLQNFMRNKYRIKEVHQVFIHILSEVRFSTGGTLHHFAARSPNLQLLQLLFNETSTVDINLKDDQ